MTCIGFVLYEATKKGGYCKFGFPATAGCFATGELAKNLAHTVHCVDEEWCGRVYNSSGGKPELSEPIQQGDKS